VVTDRSAQMKHCSDSIEEYSFYRFLFLRFGHDRASSMKVFLALIATFAPGATTGAFLTGRLIK
jgi:hypothetical protein